MKSLDTYGGCMSYVINLRLLCQFKISHSSATATHKLSFIPSWFEKGLNGCCSPTSFCFFHSSLPCKLQMTWFELSVNERWTQDQILLRIIWIRKCNLATNFCTECNPTRILSQVVLGVFDDEVTLKLLEQGVSLTLDQALTILRMAETASQQDSNLKAGDVAGIQGTY